MPMKNLMILNVEAIGMVLWLVPSGWPTDYATYRWTGWCRSWLSISIKRRNNYDAQTITERDRGQGLST